MKQTATNRAVSPVIVAGSRSIRDKSTVRIAMEDADLLHGPIDEIVHGGARGVDSLAGEIAESMGWPVKVFHAEWGEQGKAAGPIRNRRMAEYADALIAVWDGESNGTRDMIEKALKHGLDVYVKVVDVETVPQGAPV